jgi:hypothetical protein
LLIAALHAEVQKQITTMVTNAKKEMRKHFPHPDILCAFSFIDPRYYCSEEASAPNLHAKLTCLAEHNSPARPGISVEGEKLQEETSRFFQVAAVLAARVDLEQHSEEDIEAGDADFSGAEEFVLDDRLAEVCDCSK